MTKYPYYHVTSYPNYQAILNTGYLKPQIGTNSQQNYETKPTIYLFGDIPSANDAVCNWLGDQYESTTELVLLKISLNHPLPQIAFEFQYDQPIPLQNIEILQRHF